MHTDNKLRVFLRQPLTRAGEKDAAIVRDVIRQLTLAGAEVVTGDEALTADTFRPSFEARTGQAFTPSAFRAWRLTLLARSQAMVIVRTELSESGAFETAFNCAVFQRPMFIAVHSSAPIKTTLLQDLSALCPVTYVDFEDSRELAAPLGAFIDKARSWTAPRVDSLRLRMDELLAAGRACLSENELDPVHAATMSALTLAGELLDLSNGAGEPGDFGDFEQALAESRSLVVSVGTALRQQADRTRRMRQVLEGAK
jgi:hypothetical protein